MPSRNSSVIFIRCTQADLQKIKQAAKAERRTISDFVLNAVLYKARHEFPADDTYDREGSFEELQMHREVLSLVADTEDKQAVFRLANQCHSEYASASLARARRRIARAQELLSKVKQHRK